MELRPAVTTARATGAPDEDFKPDIGFGMTLTAPSTDKAVLLTEHQEGQCRAILDYQNGELGRAVYCGHPTVTKITNGGRVQTSWCPFHFDLYTRPPGVEPRAPSTASPESGRRPRGGFSRPAPKLDPTKYLTIIEAGKLLGYGAHRSYQASKSGEIPTKRFGPNRRVVVAIADIEKMLAEKAKAASGVVESSSAEMVASGLF
jgi:hypothetical protein